MQITDVIALSKAGFTADQIMQMAQVQTQPQQIQQMPQVPMQQPVQTPVQMPQPTVQVPQLMQQPTVQTPAPQSTAEILKPDPFQQLFEQMTGIKQAIQSSNIQNSQMTPAAPQTTDDILASIIQPTKPKEDK